MDALLEQIQKGADVWWMQVGETRDHRFDEVNKHYLAERHFDTIIFVDEAAKNSYEADDGYHDDLVMPLVLFSWATTNSYFKELQDINIRHVIYENKIKMIEDQLTPFGFYDDGTSEDERQLHNF